MAKYSPVRLVADSRLRLPLTSRLVQSARETPVWVLTGLDAPQDAEHALADCGVAVLRSPRNAGRLDLDGALKALAAKGVTRLMVEGGPTLAAAFVAADLVDEAVLLHSATVVGPGGIDALDSAARDMLLGRLKPFTSTAVGADRDDRYERR
jgi:diaminohydroxyphosphoribosylaminopyrimidine deaminase/5-amino-6-(5-phosphoribosylamino)uracil reductase